MKHCSIACVAIIVLTLSSCIGMDASARIGTDGSVDVSMIYTVSTAVDELGKLGARTGGANAAYLPLPVGQADLELAATRAGGQVRSWSRKDGNDSFTITAALRFPAAAAFALFLDPAGSHATYAEAGGKSTLSMTLFDGVNPADPDLVDFIRLAFADYIVAIKLELPKAITASKGYTVSGKVASFSMKAADLYASKTPVAISVTW
ncbi:MAG TPA: hypothetical protein VMX33_02225 [bacterium]|nr:hypothetical protein [bacterium]